MGQGQRIMLNAFRKRKIIAFGLALFGVGFFFLTRLFSIGGAQSGIVVVSLLLFPCFWYRDIKKESKWIPLIDESKIEGNPWLIDNIWKLLVYCEETEKNNPTNTKKETIDFATHFLLREDPKFWSALIKSESLNEKEKRSLIDECILKHKQRPSWDVAKIIESSKKSVSEYLS